jgi:glycosyltransferase involved in cell wall biosynthesis
MLSNTLSKIQTLIEQDGLTTFLSLTLNRLLLKFPLGKKVIHRPYYIAPVNNYLKPPQLTREIKGEKILLLAPHLPAEFPYPVEKVTTPEKITFLTQLSQYDVIFISALPWNDKLREICRYSHYHHLPTCAWIGENNPSKRYRQTYLSTDFIFTAQEESQEIESSLKTALEQYQKRYLPEVTVIKNLEQITEPLTGDLIILCQDEQYNHQHIFAHAYQDCDISVIPTLLRDSLNTQSFVNFSLDNFAVKREWLESNYKLLNHSISEIELGYQLYQEGYRLHFIYPLAIPQAPLNVNLFPELALVLRRKLTLTHIYENPKRLRILTYPWHISHQYELYKLPHQFTLVTDAGSWGCTGWNLQIRPIPENVNFKSIREINPKDYDLAILHFDENVLSPHNCCGEVSQDWGESFKLFREKINLPKVAICHGTPQFYGQFQLDYKESNLLETIESERENIVDYLADILVINNSYQAQKEWNFQKSKVIWHGFDPAEFPPTTYKKGVLSPFGVAVTSRPHYRGYQVYQAVFQDFPQEYAPAVLAVKEPHIILQGNDYAQTRFRNYVDDIRQYSIYFNPTIRSPMPRSRGEAMMCGLVSVSLKNHDVDLFIEQGVNGFYGETASELREILLYLLNNPRETRKIGQKSRELALDIFNHDRYLQAWQETLLQLTANP